MTIVTPSYWLGQCARESALMHKWNVHIIPNVLDTEVFKPYDRNLCHDVLGLPYDIPIILFGAIGRSRESYKGFDVLSKTLKY